MIIDVHTHIFPPRLIAERARLAREDAGFAALYANPRAKMATAEELLASMVEAGVDRAVACGFWWRSAALAGEHAAYLVEAARNAGGRIVPFVSVCGDAPIVDGAAGIGEVRLDADGALDAAMEASLARAIQAGLPLLAHCSEPAGHAYPGKAGGFTPGGLWSFLSAHAEAHAEARVIAAHWGGGFPFYALMPEVRALIETGRLVFDSAASPLLYDPRVFEVVRGLAGDGAVLWGSDFPLRSQASDRAAVEAALPDEAARAAVLGENAARFLRL